MASNIRVLPRVGRCKGGWRVRYREGGVLRSEQFATREDALQRQEELGKQVLDSAGPEVQIDGTGAPEDWSRILWELAIQVLNSGERPERKLAVIAAAAKAAHAYVDMSKIRSAQEDLRRKVGEIRRMRQDGIRPDAGTGAAA